ncbi:hypothetical protein MHZ92_07785 [Sporosarcina sp. ACRSL]|uniref:hypothetical protein n=1 Tax=Sporosarcina sp. ACRSL TaxID=2918215 RepID=UPI001EF4F275|nr:hypothetical protein [Sporosarcina sp. ACRSL]MCG7344028.1 hypothetical protein [Sporosarcina sp. ACRSL]
MSTNVLYQVNVFGEFIDIEPIPDNIMKLMPLLSNLQLMPNTIQEINPNYGLNPLNRIAFTSANINFRVEINSDKIAIFQNSPNEKGISNSLEDFLHNVEIVIDVILKAFSKKGTRASLITDTLYLDFELEKLNAIYDKVSNPLDYFIENRPFEWTVRNVSRDEYGSEQTNVILDIGRTQGSFNNSAKRIDCISGKFDINTIFENKNERFDTESVREFLIYALEKRNSIQKQLESILVG